MSRLAEWIEHRMKLLGMATQEQLAERSGISLRSLSRIFARGSLEGTERSTRLWLARTLLVGWGQLHELAAGKLDWIADDDRASQGPPLDMGAASVGASVGAAGVAILGRVAAGGMVEMLADGGEVQRLAMSFPGEPEAFALQIAGDSMSPVYLPGEMLILKCIPLEELRDGEDAMVQLDGGGDGGSTFKRVWRMDGKLKLMPLNPAYPAMDVPPERVARVGRVLGKFVPARMVGKAIREGHPA